MLHPDPLHTVRFLPMLAVAAWATGCASYPEAGGPARVLAPVGSAPAWHARVTAFDDPPPASDKDRERREALMTAFLDDLQRTGLFFDVTSGPGDPGPDVLYFTLEYSSRRCSDPPWVTMLSLGVMPDVSCVTVGYRFLLEGPIVPRPTMVDTQRHVNVIWGLPAAGINLLTGRKGAVDRDREIGRLRDTLVEKGMASEDG